MRVIENATIRAPEQAGGTAYRLPVPLEDVTLRRCRFEGWQDPRQRDLMDRVTIRRLRLERCSFAACDIGPLVIEDTVVDTAWLHRGQWGPQRIHGCLFKRVVIRGRITGGIDVQMSYLDPLASDEERRRTIAAYAEASRGWYADVDWALDISEAELTGVEIHSSGIPAQLIRRDPATQAVISRQSCEAGDWRTACGESSLWVAIERFLAGPFDDAVLVAPKRSRSFARDVAAIRQLREIGVALAD